MCPHDALILKPLQDVVFHFVVTMLSNSGVPAPNTLVPATVRLRTIPTVLRFIYLTALSHRNIVRSTTLTKRDVYYMCRALFPRPEMVDRTVDILATFVDVPRDDLALVAAPKGMVAGPVIFVDETNCRIDAALFAGEGCLIPCRPSRMQSATTQATAILV